MIFQLNKNLAYLKPELKQAISDFNSFKADFDTGKRNSVKKIELSDKIVIIKSFKIPNLLNQIVYKYIRKSKAKRSFEYANKLISLGIKTPTPIAYIENFNLVGLRQSYYMSEFLDYDLTYRELINEPNYPNREKLIRAFTKFTYNLHQNNILFLDHSPGNTLIKKNNNDYDFYLVDLNRMQFNKLTFDERMKNFSRLTPQKEMVKIMSDEYAKLSNTNAKVVFEKMWFYTQQFREKFERKKRLKKLLLNKK